MSVNGDGDAVDASIATSRRESLSVSSPKSGLNRFEDTDIYGHMQADGRIKQLQGKTLFILYEYSAFLYDLLFCFPFIAVYKWDHF